MPSGFQIARVGSMSHAVKLVVVVFVVFCVVIELAAIPLLLAVRSHASQSRASRSCEPSRTKSVRDLDAISCAISNVRAILASGR
jgi:hypothetical protein